MFLKFTGLSSVVLLLVLLINLAIGGLATEYVVEFWVALIQRVPSLDVPFWPCAIAGLFLGQFMVPAAVLTWLISLFI